MTDLLRVLPNFPVGRYGSLISALERYEVTTSDLLTMEAAELGRRTQLPLLDVKRLCEDVVKALHADLGVLGGLDVAGGVETSGGAQTQKQAQTPRQQQQLRHTTAELAGRWSTISTLDPALDEALGGGVPTGCVTEVTGESGAGKTQLLLALLLAVQLPPPHGLGRPAMYISTEAALSTRRLAQILASNPILRAQRQQRQQQQQQQAGGGGRAGGAPPPPSLDSILSIATPDLESQDHILTFQVPVEVARRNVGLVVLDSVAANFRAEFERNTAGGGGGGGGGAASASAPSSSNNMGARTAELIRLGAQLRDLARTHNLAVVVANQVADRFSGGKNPVPSGPASLSSSSHRHHQLGGGGGSPYTVRMTQESPLASRSRANGPAAPQRPPQAEDHQPSSSLPESAWPPPRPGLGDANVPYFGGRFPFPFSFSAPPEPAQHIPALVLDHQQRWFTGWGDEEEEQERGDLKTPSLGLVWTTQIASRIALLKRPTYERQPRHGVGGGGDDDDDDDDGDVDMEDGAAAQPPTLRTWRRWMKVVFAPHVAPSGPGVEGAVEFEINNGGLKGAGGQGKGRMRRREDEGG